MSRRGRLESPTSILTLTVALACCLATESAYSQSVNPRERPTTATPTCATNGCHANIVGSPVLHGPVAVQSCSACHTPADSAKHTFTRARQGNDLCLFCHEVQSQPVMHKPVVDGSCLDCHNPHGGKTRGFLITDSAAQLCAKCHQDVTARGKHKHGPVAAGGCVACHEPHASKFTNLLLKEPRQLCLECHVATARRLDQSKSVHKPVTEDCLGCHDAHAADEPMLLKSATQSLCLSCHESMRSTMEHAKTQHGAMIEGRQCLNCHDAHASNFPRILRNNPMSLCMECHNKAIKTPEGVVADMSVVLATGKSLHGPVAQQNCSACHQIHGGDNFRLLIKEYPPEFYAPFKEESYALCFSCHERKLVLESKTTALTGFRNGDTNLHFMHVNRQTKGRTCRACHETHASDQAKHIRSSVPFGKWDLPINYEKTETGGSCAPGCHAPYRYDRDKPVRYERAAGQAPAIWPTKDSQDGKSKS